MSQELLPNAGRERVAAPVPASLPSSFSDTYIKPCPPQLSPSCCVPSFYPLTSTQFWPLTTEAAKFSLAYTAEKSSAGCNGMSLVPQYLCHPLIWCWLFTPQSGKDQQRKPFRRGCRHDGLEGPFSENEWIDAVAFTSRKCSAESGLGNITQASR